MSATVGMVARETSSRDASSSRDAISSRNTWISRDRARLLQAPVVVRGLLACFSTSSCLLVYVMRHRPSNPSWTASSRHMPFLFTYLDDHIIYSQPNLEEHYDHLRQFLPSFRRMVCRSTPPRACLQRPVSSPMGHRVDQHGVRALFRVIYRHNRLSPVPESDTTAASSWIW
jgi:hypothetical protein